ncbi:MAG: hypothetical protein ACE5F4_02530 [Candidatus Paceibacteria bacterium]
MKGPINNVKNEDMEQIETRAGYAGAEAKSAEQYWLSGREHIERVHAEGGWQEYADGIHEEERERLFSTRSTCVCCMDERVAFGSGETLDAVYAAGCGILIKDDVEKRQAFVAALKERGVTDVYSHAECGAVALYAEQKGIALAEALLEADTWYRELADALGGTYHADLAVSPEGHHVAQTLYWDATGTFNPGKVPGIFPTGFVVTEPVVGTAHAKEHVDVALGIALGEHGFGTRFSAAHPFEIVVVAPSAEELMRIQALLEPFVERHGGAVRIDGLIR